MSYKNAFKCRKCPESNGAEGCPMWWEIVEKHIKTTETRVNKLCGYVMLPVLLNEVIQASNQPAKEINQVRNEIAIGLSKVATVIEKLPIIKRPGG